MSTTHAEGSVKVAVIGVGLVGTEFVNQLLSFPSPSPFRLVALQSSKKLLSNPDGLLELTLSNWKGTFDQTKEMENLPKTAEEKRDQLHRCIKGLSKLVKLGQRVVLVDNTSDEIVAGSYPVALGYGIDVITPNKKAFSGSAALYSDILCVASNGSGAEFLNESTVGAGLPIISTLKGLVGTGDKIRKIEGVFSGTMSYIFNKFSTGEAGGDNFSEVVFEAKKAGYTEPDPREDLNGADVARKLTILYRTIISHAVDPQSLKDSELLVEGFKEVNPFSLVPEGLESVSLQDFMDGLPKSDAKFSKTREDAAKDGKVLRYVGVVDLTDPSKPVIKAGLEQYPKNHAFATSLQGSDNIIMFHTERYGGRPLIVQGAGAGAAVTAMGVMSDLLKLA
ncbi:hypothetical protein CONPUDRAFT_138650 [Coniophora puteana RWD-64-598 SS2]|uniref:Homoserine dehydrogenase n=1 Tax=Coniophora puteana (strain RWD-64-598) TaxID=741705 RepID=A0A5M3MI53_CONPW|nr:uncharacterized protein CONPUDRAFT_138650 [Coniophora puteana RWD-64-598 SS2]EIW78325.1 hypothetical protein CONPUDRAFT_138650 [Coniophora puteana RWD-64-598 SS2]